MDKQSQKPPLNAKPVKTKTVKLTNVCIYIYIYIYTLKNETQVTGKY